MGGFSGTLLYPIKLQTQSIWLTKKVEPPPAQGVNRDSRTATQAMSVVTVPTELP
jgi:hypothetical protein